MLLRYEVLLFIELIPKTAEFVCFNWFARMLMVCARDLCSVRLCVAWWPSHPKNLSDKCFPSIIFILDVAAYYKAKKNRKAKTLSWSQWQKMTKWNQAIIIHVIYLWWAIVSAHEWTNGSLKEITSMWNVNQLLATTTTTY